MRRRRRIRRILLATLALLLLVLAAAFATRSWMHRSLDASLPEVDGKLTVSGLQAAVTVERDAHGVPHLTASSMDDLLFAQGYVTAQDRLWQMDMLRRHAAGELAEVLGSSMVEHDRTQRYLQLRAVADRSIPTMDAEERHSLERYAEGVNAEMAAAADHLPAEFRLLGYQPRPWTARDSLLVGFAMAEDLSTEYPEKLNREAVAAKLPADLMAELYPVGSFRDHPPAEGKPDLSAPREMIEIPLDESQSKLASPEHLQDLLHARSVLAQSVSALRCEGCAAGSNNWVVSGARTKSGKPMVANDMHLGITVPGIWYTADLQAGDFHVSGVSLPGVPYVVVGHNAHVAWGFTNSSADVQDLYVEQVSGDQFRAADGSMQPLVHQRETIRVKHGRDVSFDVAETRHGNALTPLISPLFPRDKRDLALRWTLFEPGFASMPFGKVNAAADGASLVNAFAHFGGPSQNLVYADDAGHIGYHLLGSVPLRGANGQSGLSPVPVDSGSYEWTSFIPYDQLPAVTDPQSGLLATANARITPDSYPYQIALDWELPYRNERIWRVLGERTGLQPQDMTALQGDTYSALDKTVAERVAYAVDHANSPSKRARAAAEMLRKWDGRVSADAPEPNITQAVRVALLQMLLEPKLGKAWQLYTWRSRSYAIEEILEHEPAQWLPERYTNWNDFLTAALEEGLKERSAPAKLKEWAWGSTDPMHLQHPIFGRAWYLRWLAGPSGPAAKGLPGNAFTVRASSGVHGASERFVADLADPDSATMTLPMGESGNTHSPWFGDQWPAWSEGQPLPLSGPAAHTLVLTPR